MTLLLHSRLDLVVDFALVRSLLPIFVVKYLRQHRCLQHSRKYLCCLQFRHRHRPVIRNIKLNNLKFDMTDDFKHYLVIP